MHWSRSQASSPEPLSLISAATRLDIPLPEITFGNNLVSLKRKGKQGALDSDAAHDLATSTTITFTGLDALAQVDTTGEDTIKVAYADEWAKSRNLDNANTGSTDDGTSVIETVKNYDWTYSTTYAGTCQGGTVSYTVNVITFLGPPFLTV